MTLPIDSRLLYTLLRELVAIDSVNPTLVPGANGEKKAAEVLYGFLRHHGIRVELQEAALGRPNVVAWLGPDPSPGQNGKPRAALAVLAHLDTVGAGDMPNPFTPIERDGKLYGRGALDIKSGAAAMAAAGIAVANSGITLEKPVLLAGVVDEECDSIGTTALLERVTADCAVVLEPTNLQLVVAHKGYAWFEVTTQGRAAHGSLPSEGKDAIRMMSRVLQVLDENDAQLSVMPPHPLLGHASLHASLINGGQELSSYPAVCRLQFERRTVPGESELSIATEFKSRLEQIQAQVPGFAATLRSLGSRPAYEISPDAPIVRATARAILTITGDVSLAGMAPWTDTALLAQAGIPGVVFGPEGRGLHGREEYVELASVDTCSRVLSELMLAFTASRDIA